MQCHAYGDKTALVAKSWNVKTLGIVGIQSCQELEKNKNETKFMKNYGITRKKIVSKFVDEQRFQNIKLIRLYGDNMYFDNRKLQAKDL